MIARVGSADLLEQHARLLFDTDADGRILAVNEPEADPPPRLWLSRGLGGDWLILGRSDVPAELVDRLNEVVGGLRAFDGAPMGDADRARIAEAGDGELEGGPAFRFTSVRAVPPVDGLRVLGRSDRTLLEHLFPFTARHLAARGPVVAVVREGEAVALCSSVRSRADAAEAGVFTAEAWRGQGFGRAAVAAWRDAVIAEGRVPWYSTSWDNVASLGVARSLGLEPVAEELGLG